STLRRKRIGGPMSSNVVPIHIGDAQVLIEVTPVAGTEPTSKSGDAAQKVLGAFETVKDTIVDMAVSTKEVIDKTPARAVRPDHMEVQFGLKVSAQGNVIVAGASASASITVKLTYDAQPSGDAANR